MYSWVVRVKCKDILNAHSRKLVEHKCGIKRLASLASVLSALIEHGHNDRDTACLAAHCGNYSLQVLIMVIGAHVVLIAVHIICNAVIEAVAYDIYIMTSYGLVNDRLCLACTEARAMHMCDVAVNILHISP